MRGDLNREKEKNKELKSELQYKNDQLFLEDRQWEKYIKHHYIDKNIIRDKIEELKDGTYDAEIVLKNLLEDK